MIHQENNLRGVYEHGVVCVIHASYHVGSLYRHLLFVR